ncbi:hypothetical protein HKX48_007867 [Thoreauomyces humboldtii]|nr:hypothetical protein HKX48_007867 [Thoreauomyces humboldtii]
MVPINSSSTTSSLANGQLPTCNFHSIPYDALLAILRFLPTPDKVHLAACSRVLHQQVSQEPALRACTDLAHAMHEFVKADPPSRKDFRHYLNGFAIFARLRGLAKPHPSRPRGWTCTYLNDRRQGTPLKGASCYRCSVRLPLEPALGSGKQSQWVDLMCRFFSHLRDRDDGEGPFSVDKGLFVIRLSDGREYQLYHLVISHLQEGMSRVQSGLAAVGRELGVTEETMVSTIHSAFPMRQNTVTDFVGVNIATPEEASSGQFYTRPIGYTTVKWHPKSRVWTLEECCRPAGSNFFQEALGGQDPVPQEILPKLEILANRTVDSAGYRCLQLW